MSSGPNRVEVIDMWWAALWMLVTIVGAIGTVASVNSVRFSRRVTEEVRVLAASSSPRPRTTRPAVNTLPAPVQRYLAQANANRCLKPSGSRSGVVPRNGCNLKTSTMSPMALFCLAPRRP